jgi:hypothetical protein
MMFVVSLIEFSKHVQNEISAKVMPKPQNFTADFADRTDRRNYVPPKTPNYAVGLLAKVSMEGEVAKSLLRIEPKAHAR